MDEPSLFDPAPAPTPTLADLRQRAATCTNCGLYRDATRTVFGQGSVTARLMLVGEQPGDREDLAGRPFVGPSGQLLDRGLVDAGIDREDVYVTNVVKHFKFIRRGRRRIHQKPGADEIGACRPWLDGELTAVRPEVVVALGATAAKALLGPSFRVSRQRGEVFHSHGARCTATLHPSAILRLPDGERAGAVGDFVDDLTAVAALLGG